jgi:hypothetical protein
MFKRKKITLLVATLLSMSYPLFAYAQLGSPPLCDPKTCNLSSFGALAVWVFGVLFFLLVLVSPLTLGWRVVSNGWSLSSPEARKALNKALVFMFIGILGFMFCLPLLSLLLKASGVDERIQKPIDTVNQQLQSYRSIPFVQVAHAQSSQTNTATKSVIPQTAKFEKGPIGAALDLFDVFMRVLLIVVVFFWVIGGAWLVYARGRTSELQKAKDFLWYVVYATVILIFVQIFLLALR